MSFSTQGKPPPNPNATTPLLFDSDKLTADGKRTLSELERTTKVGRTLSSEDLSAGLQRVQHCNPEHPDSTPESFAPTFPLMIPTALLLAQGQVTSTTPLAQGQVPSFITSFAYKVAFSPCGRFIATVGDEEDSPNMLEPILSFRLWDIRTSTAIYELIGLDKRIRHLAFSPSGQLAFPNFKYDLLSRWPTPRFWKHRWNYSTIRHNLG
ncbi:MAG: hypothetical protein J3R72DRAFT_425734 [Linnemannia gamsii]|nr:MAG: hypothetical protein J3R72DRAFT_425734 [Linnemannia gamsii]